jgi:hypothetical protein
MLLFVLLYSIVMRPNIISNIHTFNLVSELKRSEVLKIKLEQENSVVETFNNSKEIEDILNSIKKMNFNI